jgi:hypothetical protein
MIGAPQDLRADILAWIDARIEISSARTSVSTLALLALKGEVEAHGTADSEICMGCADLVDQRGVCERLRAIAKTLGIGEEGR